MCNVQRLSSSDITFAALLMPEGIRNVWRSTLEARLSIGSSKFGQFSKQVDFEGTKSLHQALQAEHVFNFSRAVLWFRSPSMSIKVIHHQTGLAEMRQLTVFESQADVFVFSIRVQLFLSFLAATKHDRTRTMCATRVLESSYIIISVICHPFQCIYWYILIWYNTKVVVFYMFGLSSRCMNSFGERCSKVWIVAVYRGFCSADFGALLGFRTQQCDNIYQCPVSQIQI
jgi:hypothetical protein